MGRIVKSECKMNFSVKMSVATTTGHAHGTDLKIVQNSLKEIVVWANIFIKYSYILFTLISYSFQIRVCTEYIIINFIFKNFKHFYL